MPALYLVPALRRRFRAGAAARLDDMAGAFAGVGPPGVGWRVTETLRGLAAVYSIEIHGGDWPEGAAPTLTLERRRIAVEGDGPAVPDGLVDRLLELQVESWEGVHGAGGHAFRFRPMGATHVMSIFPPMRYTRGLDEGEARLAAEICELSAALVGAGRTPVPS